MNPADTQERMFDEDGGIDDDIRRPILDRTAPAPPASWSSSLRDGLRRALLWNGDEAGLRSQLGSRLATLQQQVNSAGPAAAAGGSDGDRDGLGGGEDGRANGEGGPVADDLRSLPDGANRGDVNAAARWLEDTMPFAMLLLLVFLYRHLVSILVFCWLTSMLHTANERMRRQAMLRDNRSHRALLSVIGLLVAEIAAIFLMQNERLLKQLTLCKVDDFTKEPPPLSLLLWDVLLADLAARSAVLLLKAAVASVAPSSAGRRLRRVYSAIEAVGVCYRMLLPMPLWFHWLFHAGENADNHATIWSIGCSHLYVGFKLVGMVDRVRAAAQAWKSVLFVSLPMGKYASTEEVMELGENRECTICTDEHTAPVRLECGHIYCEECITSWCERNTGACTCPLCRAPIASTLGTHSDGTTALLPQIF